MAKIAFILLCHKDPEAIIQQAERLTAVGDYMAIHFDASANPKHFVMIKDAVGWRVSWAIAAGFAFLAIPLLVWLLQKERTPQSHAEEKGATGMGARHWTRAEAIRHPLFWAFCPSIFDSEMNSSSR